MDALLVTVSRTQPWLACVAPSVRVPLSSSWCVALQFIASLVLYTSACDYQSMLLTDEACCSSSCLGVAPHTSYPAAAAASAAAVPWFATCRAMAVAVSIPICTANCFSVKAVHWSQYLFRMPFASMQHPWHCLGS